MFGIDHYGFTGIGLVGNQVMPPGTFIIPGHVLAGFLEYHHVANAVTATHGNAFIYRLFQWQGFAATVLAVRGDDGDCAGVDNTLVQALGREAAQTRRSG